MKQLFLLINLTFSFVVSAQDSWQQIDSMNGPGKATTTSFVVLDTPYVVGGITEIDFTRKMYSYNPTQDDWDDEISWGGEGGGGQNRGNAISFVIDNIAYVGLGQGTTAGFFNDMWKFDAVNQTWTQMADFEGEARRGASAFSYDGFGYIGLGQTALGLKNDFYKYNPNTNSWGQIGDFDGPARKNAVVISMGAQVYIGTGEASVDLNDFWEYQPWSDSWVARTSLPGLGRNGAVGWGIFPQAFIALGEDANGTLKNDVWEFNYFTNVWSQRANFPGTPRKLATAFVVNNTAFVGTGYSLDGYKDDFYSYTKVARIAESDLETTVVVYPNPSSDFIYIETKHLIKELKVFSVDGKCCKTIVNSNKLAISELNSGEYTLVIELESGLQMNSSFIKN